MTIIIEQAKVQRNWFVKLKRCHLLKMLEKIKY